MTSHNDETLARVERKRTDQPARALSMQDLLDAPRHPVREIQRDDKGHYSQLPGGWGIVLLFRENVLVYADRTQFIQSFIGGSLRIHETGYYVAKTDLGHISRLALAEYIDARSIGTANSRRRAQLQVEAWLEDCELAWIECSSKTAKLTMDSLVAPPPVTQIVARLEREKLEPKRAVLFGHEMNEESARNRISLLGVAAGAIWLMIVNHLLILAGADMGWDFTLTSLLEELGGAALLSFFFVGIVPALFEGLFVTVRQHAIATSVAVFAFPFALHLIVELLVTT